MSGPQLPLFLTDEVLQMGFSFSALELAHQATNSSDSNILLEWILTHENEIRLNNNNESNETHLASEVIQKVTEFGFPERSVELAQRKTKSNDVKILIEWILNHDQSEEHRLTPMPPNIPTNQSTTTITKNQEAKKKTDNTLLNDLLKLGFDANDIENCFIDLNINIAKKFDLKIKRTECIDWLINNSQKKAQSKAKEINRSQKQLRIPQPIKLNNYQNSKTATTSQTITNNFLKEIHLSGRHQTIDNDEQQLSLTPEEACMADIHENLKKQSWTIYNLDQLNLIQKYIKTIAKIVIEDRRNIQRYNDDDDDDNEIEPIQASSVRQAKKNQTKKIVTLADLAIRDQTEYKSNLSNTLATPPTKIPVPGALEEADWDPSLLTELDRIAVQLEYRRGENYRQLANRLIEQCHVSANDQLKKVRAIFVWITNHIRYDIETSPRDNLNDKNEDDMDKLCQLILQSSSCVCVGFAVLFKRMCQHFNIQVDYITGYTKLTKSCINDTANADNVAKLSGHAWTMVHLNGKTYFTDPTWSAARWSSSNKRTTPFTNTYYLVVPENSIYQFRPHNDGDQHLVSPWSINKFLHEPCFYPHFFRSKFSLEDRDTEWCYYRLCVERDQQKFLTKSFRIRTKKGLNNKYRLMISGNMYWSNDLAALSENISQLENTNYEHKIEAVEFQQIDMTYADNRLKDKKPVFIGELKDIPIYPPKLNVSQIQYGLLKIYTTDKSTGYFEPIFECIFDFQ